MFTLDTRKQQFAEDQALMESQWGGSVWSLIVEHVPQRELPEVSRVLGESLVDMHTEVLSEAEMWREIWRGMQQGGDHADATAAPRVRGRKPPLADPPVVRELLRAEVCMLLQAVRERAAKEGRDDEEVLLQYRADVVSYALSRPNSRSDPHPDPSPRASSHCSVGSSHDEIEAVRDKLNVTDIDQVVAHLQCVLTEECESLRSEVSYLQMTVEAEHRGGCKDIQTEPTLTELREQRKAIQLDLERPILVPRYHSSSSSSSLSMDELDHRSRMSAGQRAVDETLRPSTPLMSPPPHPLPRCKPCQLIGPPRPKDCEPIRPGRVPPLATTQRQQQSSVPTSSQSKPERQSVTEEASEGQEETAHFSTKDRLQSRAGCDASSSSPSVLQSSPRNSNMSAHHRTLSLIKDSVLVTDTEKGNGPLAPQTLVHDSSDPSSPVPALSASDERWSQPPAERPDRRCSTSGINHSVSVTRRREFRNDRRDSIYEDDSVSVNVAARTQNGSHNGVIASVINDPPSLASDEPQTHSNCMAKCYSVTTTDPLLTPNGGKLSFSGHGGNNNSCPLGNHIMAHKPKCSSLVCHDARPPLTRGTHHRQTLHPLPASIETDGQSFSLTKQQDGDKTQATGAKGPQTEQKLAMTSFQPVPPSIPKGSTRRQPLARRLCVLHKDSLMGL